MVSFRIFASATILAVAAPAGSALAQTCLDQNFSDDTEFSIYSNDQARYPSFLFRDRDSTGDENAIYWTSDVEQLIDEMRASTSDWRETDDGWSNGAIALEFVDGGSQCNAAIDGLELYAAADAGGGMYVRTLGRSERNGILDRLTEISRLMIQ